MTVSAELAFRDRLVFEPIGDDGLLIDLETGIYFRLNASAARACAALRDCASDTEAIALLTGRVGMPVEHARALLQNIRGQLAVSRAPAKSESPFAYRRHDDGYALEENGTPIMWTDAGGLVLRLLLPPAALHLELGRYVRAMTPKLLQLRGATVVHASACALPEGLIAIAGESGAGKTTTARALAAVGGELISEDLLVFARDGADVVIFEAGERRAHAWTGIATEGLARDPTASIACDELDAVEAGARRPIGAIWFIDRQQRARNPPHRRAGRSVARDHAVRPRGAGGGGAALRRELGVVARALVGAVAQPGVPAAGTAVLAQAEAQRLRRPPGIERHLQQRPPVAIPAAGNERIDNPDQALQPPAPGRIPSSCPRALRADLREDRRRAERSPTELNAGQRPEDSRDLD